MSKLNLNGISGFRARQKKTSSSPFYAYLKKAERVPDGVSLSRFADGINEAIDFCLFRISLIRFASKTRNHLGNLPSALQSLLRWLMPETVGDLMLGLRFVGERSEAVALANR